MYGFIGILGNIKAPVYIRKNDFKNERLFCSCGTLPSALITFKSSRIAVSPFIVS